MKSCLFDYSDPFIHVKGRVTIVGHGGDGAAAELVAVGAATATADSDNKPVMIYIKWW